MEKKRFSLGTMFVALTAAAVAFTFLFVAVPQLLYYAAESRTSPMLPLALSTFIIYLLVAGWWQIRGGASPVDQEDWLPSVVDDLQD